MLRYKDKNGIVSPLIKYKDLYIEKVLDYGDKTLGFGADQSVVNKIELEDYIITKTDEYVIKQINDSDNNFYDIVAKLNIDALEGNAIQKFETVEQTALNSANLAIAGTGWTCECDIKKKRTVRMTNSSSWDILKKIADTFRLEMTIDSLNKKIVYKEKIGEDKGCYFSDQLNLVSLSSQSDTTNFYTRILPIGKDGLTIESVNNGSKFLENHTYSAKNKTYIWKDERYTVPESLKEDAAAKLEELACPYISYSCKLIDLDNSCCDVGDVITIINKQKHTRIKQRIVKLKHYPDNPADDTCEISNLKLSFSSYVNKYNNTTDTVDNITNDNGTVDGDCIDNIDASKVLNIDTVIANNAEFVNTKTKVLEVEQSMTAAEARIGTLEATTLKSTDADIKYANIDFSNIGKAAMEYFYAHSGLIKNVVVGDQQITGELIGVTIKGDLIEGNTIVAEKLVIKGDDGLYYKLNTDGMGVEAEQTEYNSLNGSIIRAKSITATKIAVDDLVAFDATIAGFNITDEAIYSGVKESALNTTRGIYLGKDGQLAFGDGNNYLRFYKDSSGRYKLEISAESMNFSSTGASVEDTIKDINDKVDSVVSVEKSEVTYQAGVSGTVKPTGTWLKDMPSVNTGQFLWTRTLITYSDKSVTELFSVSSMGTKGDKGPKGENGEDGSNFSWNLIHNGNFSLGTKYIAEENSTIKIIDDSTFGKVCMFNITSDYQRIMFITQNVWKANQWYTVSFYAKSSIAGKIIVPSRSLADGPGGVNLSTNWTKYTCTFKCTTTADGGTLSFQASDSNATYYLANVKLEYGKKASEWSPHKDEIKGDTGSQGPQGVKGDKGAAGADAIIISITSSSGTIFKNNSGTTILTAHVYKGGIEQAINTNGVCGSLGTVKWYKGTSLISAASAINVSAADVNNTQIYTCQLEG